MPRRVNDARGAVAAPSHLGHTADADGPAAPWIPSLGRQDRGGPPTVATLSSDLERDKPGVGRARGRPAWDLVLFCVGLLVLGVLGGIVIGLFRLPPSATVRGALEAADDWRENWRDYLRIRSQYLLPTARTA